ncbi:MAG: histone deacetylase [bacterium]|nr:histone deacetylase [bacterium]
MRVCFDEGYTADLPDGHRFPMGKFAALHQILLGEGLIRPHDVQSPREAHWEDLELVHTGAFLGSLRYGTMDHKAERRMGLPRTDAIVRRSRLATQGTYEAGAMAWADGIAANLAGGMHHGFPDHAEGFCVLNDVAVAIRMLQRDMGVTRILVVDLDVHQGNGIAAIFEHDASVYTFSMHGEKNYPFVKQKSSRDVALPDGMDNGPYLDLLQSHLPGAIDEARPDLVYYLAGVDTVAGDRLGRLALTRDGLAARDHYVLETMRSKGLPVALVLSGGYAESDGLTADLHAEVHRAAKAVFG